MSKINKKILIDANFPSETRVALLDSKNNIEGVKSETINKRQNKGNIYLARISRIEPSLQAVFIEYGGDRSGFLPFTEIHPDYHNLKPSDIKGFLKLWNSINPPKITRDDLKEKQPTIPLINLEDQEEIDIEAIKKIIDEKIESEFDIGAEDNEIDPLDQKSDKSKERAQINIMEVLKKGQVLLVQLTKEERGSKGASFTTYLSLAGKYCVLMPNKASNYGISRKILNASERKRLKDIIKELSEYTKTASIIARTAAIGHTTLEIKKDYEYLARLWNKIRSAAEKISAPCFIHQEEDLIQKVIRDMCDRYVDEVLIQGQDAYQKAIKFIEDISPSDINKIKEYKESASIFTKFEVEDQLMKLYQPIVHLTSGGYIVINPTEALISIDVNSGKLTTERNIEDTALKTNLEAAKEISRQVKLRGLSGLIVIDFIDMQEIKNRKIVERSFKEFLSFDKAKIQISPISNFGLLEMSRQRMQSSFLETHTSMCTHCSGKGIIRANESNAMLILRTIENEIFADSVKADIVNIYANNNAVIYLLNNKRAEVNLIEEKYKIKLNFYIDPLATSDSYSLEKVKSATKIENIPIAFQRDTDDKTNNETVGRNRKKVKNKKRDLIGANKPPEEVQSSFTDDLAIKESIEIMEHKQVNLEVDTAKISNEEGDNIPEVVEEDIEKVQVKNIIKKKRYANKKRQKINKKNIIKKEDEAVVN